MRFDALSSGFRASLCVAMVLVMGGVVMAQTPAPQPDRPQDAQANLPPAPPTEFLNRIPAAQMTFLNDYANKTTKELWKDKRFKELLKAITPRTTYHYGHDLGLSDALEEMLTGSPLPVDVQDGRYVLVTSQGGPILEGRGFVWFDMQEGIGLGGVYFHPVNGEPTPTLAIFSKQLKTNTLAWGQLPPAFRQGAMGWSRSSRVPVVTVTYFIPENGKKYALIHDEDYCAPPIGSGMVNDQCQQRNAEAADADMNAAYFMDETGHAANATAWMLNGEQTAWIGMRNNMCGVSVACRIALARKRTGVLIRR
jgi:Lysozyme inhibitor LprI